jgi:hypothetical protein
MFRQHVTELDSALELTSRKQFLKLAYDLTKDLKVPRRFNKEMSSEMFLSVHEQASSVMLAQCITHKFKESIRTQQMSAVINPSQNVNKLRKNMLLLRIAYSMQMKQGYHLFLLTAKCFLLEAKKQVGGWHQERGTGM